MEKHKFSATELTNYRPVMQAYSTLFGKILVCPKTDLLDLDYFDKEKEKEMRLAEPIKKCYIKTTTITSIELDLDANDKPVLIFNHDVDLTFPLQGNEKPNLEMCTPEKINDAIRNFAASEKLTFFADVEAVTKVVTSYNEREAKKLEAFAEKCIMDAQALRDINKLANDESKEYVESLKALKKLG